MTVSPIPDVKTDQQLAGDLRREITAALQVIIDIRDRALKAGLVVDFQIGVGLAGRSVISSITISKPL